ncbi:MAG: hypothetical protein HYR94_12550, partial [Chloroflexi bacterium]|nr:hypothetical protein [Chloroflexota bacterium]
ILTWLTNFELFLHHAQQRLEILTEGGSGLEAQRHSGAGFIWRKFWMLEEVAHPEHWVTRVIFVALVIGSMWLLWQWRGRMYQQSLVGVIWLGWLANTVWFVGLSTTGWPRHYWSGLILAVILSCVIVTELIRIGWQKKEGIGWWRPGALIMGLVWLGLIGWGMASQQHVWGFFLPDELVPYWLEQRYKYVSLVGLPWILIPRAAQDEVVDYINRMPPEANVYYPYGHKAAEIPPLTGRINYPLQRRTQPGVIPHPADILLIHPFIVSPWTHDPAMRQELLRLVDQSCPQPVLKNDYYIICRVEELRLPP